jgi:hypothetical protein
VPGVQGLPGPTGPAGPQGPAGQTRLNYAVRLDNNGSAAVALPAAVGSDISKPPLIACYVNFNDNYWYPVGNAFDGQTGTPWCDLAFVNSSWTVEMFSSTAYAGYTAGFVVVY